MHNPAEVSVVYTDISIPHGHFDLFTYSEKNKSFTEVKGSVLCDNEFLENGVLIDNCRLYIE